MRQVLPLLLLLAVAALPAVAAAQLNPTVKVLPRATSPVPPECGEGVAPQTAQRLTTDERTAVRDTSADMQAPPSSSLRGELRRAVEAAQRNDRNTFRDSLSRAHTLLGSYAPGGERNAAMDLVAVLDDIDRVWDLEFTSATGAFFDAGSDVFKVASKYPGYDAFIRKQVIVDANGIRFYPTRETLDFLTSEAANRLARLTGQALPGRAAARGHVIERQGAAPPASAAVSSKPARTTTTTKRATSHTAHAHKPARKATTRTTHRTEHKAVARQAHLAPPPAPRKEQPSQGSMKNAPKATKNAPAATKNATTATQPPPPSAPAPAQSAAPPPPSPATTTTGTTTAADTNGTTATTASAAAPVTASTAPPPVATSDTSTTTAQPAKKAPASQGRSFMIPILLIIVGAGVLVMLFRASS